MRAVIGDMLPGGRPTLLTPRLVLPRVTARLRRNPGWVALALYLTVSVALQLPVLAHLNSRCICSQGGSDPMQFMWAMVWWPYAIVHGLNPFVTHVIWAGRDRFDLASATTTPAASLLAWPVTALAGPLVSYNLVALLAPVTAAWFAFRLCLHVTRHPAAAMLGGYLFGFSSYEWDAAGGHEHLSVTLAIPAAVLLTLQRHDGVITARRYVALMALVLAFQLLTSTEVLLTLTVAGALAVACGLAIADAAARRRIVRLLPEIGAAYGVMGLVCSPFLYYAFIGPAVSGGGPLSADVLGFFFPTTATALGGQWFSGVSSAFHGGSYLGLPLIVIVATWLVQRWHARATRFVAALLALLVVWTLGDHLYVDGHRTIRLPWVLFWHLPLFKQLEVVRVGVYISLVCALIAAIWLARAGARPWKRWTLALLAIVFLFPATHSFHSRTPTPAFFTTNLYRRYLHRGEVILPLPYGGAPYGFSLLWQARTDMYFRLASGGFAYFPPSYPLNFVLELDDFRPAQQNAPGLLRGFLVAQRVSAVVATPQHSQPWLGVLAKEGLRPISVGGVLIYRIPRAWSKGSST